jgi:hypothetical protein
VTPAFAYFIVCGFVSFLIIGAVFTEQTERGKRWVDRAIDWVERSRRITR